MSLPRSPLARLIVLALVLSAATACVSPAGDTPEAKRASALAMRDHVLAQAVAMYPELKEDLATAPAYAVLDTGIFKTIIGHVGGYGVAVDQATHKETFLKESMWALGPLCEFGNGSSVFVFHDKAAFDALLAGDLTWKFGADADASFKFGSFGGDVSAATLASPVSIYRVFQTGLGLNACIFWASIEPDHALNP